MESKLDLILASLDSEEKTIKDWIKDFLDEGDYKFAFLQAKGLRELSSQINRLKQIEDPLFEEKHFLQTRIHNIQKSLSRHLTSQLKDYFLNELQAAETELETLELRQKDELLMPKQTILDDCLLLLFSKKVKSVAVIFSKKTDISSILTLRGRTLTIRITGLKSAISEGWLDSYHIRKAEKLGFIRLTGSTALKLKLQGEQVDLITQSKLILARLTFDVLPYSSMGHEGFIKLS